MSEHFIKNIEIKDFKCFKDFKAKGFGRVNLIGGKNNVGKTVFMEASCSNIYSEDVESTYTTLMYITYVREKLEYINKILTQKIDQEFFENIKTYHTKTNIREVKYNLYEKEGKKEYRFEIDNKKTYINSQEFSYNRKLKTSILFIDGKGFTNKHLKKIYAEVQKRDKEDELNSFLESFDNDIEKFKIFEDSPECKVKSQDNYLKLNEFGDGLRSYISIICALYACSDSYLFIDEIENGIHYTNLDKLWEIILTISKKQNVQVFATTHSKECIESYARVAQKLNDEEITFIKLAKLKDSSIKAGVYDSEMVINAVIEQEHEVRGW